MESTTPKQQWDKPQHDDQPLPHQGVMPSARAVAEALWLASLWASPNSQASPLRQPAPQHPPHSNVREEKNKKLRLPPERQSADTPLLTSLAPPASVAETLISAGDEWAEDTEDTGGNEIIDTTADMSHSAEASLLPLSALPEEANLPHEQIWLEDPKLLVDTCTLARALEPLRSAPLPSPRQFLDLQATVERMVQQAFCLPGPGGLLFQPTHPVWQALHEARFELVLLVDGGVSMWLWQKLAKELKRLLRIGGTFRGLRVLQLCDEVGSLCPPPLAAKSPTGATTLVLLLSDCVGNHWWSQELVPQLSEWCKTLPLAVLQVLPRWMWGRTALGMGEPVSLISKRMAQAVWQYQPCPSESGRMRTMPHGPLLPVISWDDTSLNNWSRVVMGDPDAAVAGYRLSDQERARAEPSAGLEEVARDPERQLRDFRASASSQAVQLAGLLAAAPVLSLPVMHLVRKALMRADTNPLVMAEVLLSGILQVIPGQKDRLSQGASRDQVQFMFRPGLRPLLRNSISPVECIDVVNAVSDLVARRLHISKPEQFQAMLVDSRRLPVAEREAAQVFGTLLAETIEALGGVYKQYAEKLRTGALRPQTLAPAVDGVDTSDILEEQKTRPDVKNDIKPFQDYKRLNLNRLSVFLSHTSELAKYPEDLSYVAKAKQAIESAGHMVVDMATFRAQPIAAEDYDTKRVKECDIYIGIYGNKYGSLTSKKISFAESEYDAAVEAGLQCYIFLLDEDSAGTDLPIHCLKPDKYRGKRRAFLKKISNSAIYKLFGNRDHLCSLISDALHDLAETNLRDALGHHELIDPLLIPFNFNAYRKQRSRGFIGREWLFMQVRSWLQERRDQQGLLITAGFGVGKTAFMAQLVENNNTGLPLAAQHFCQGGQNSTLSPGRFVTSIAAQLVESLPAYRRRLQAPEAIVLLDLLKNASHQPEDAWNQAVVSVLHEIEEPGIDHLLVVDALELTLQYRPSAGEANDVGIADLLAADPPLPRWMRILATSRNDDEVVTTLRASNFAHETIRAHHADNLSDLRAYTEVRCETAALNRVLSAAQLSSQQVADKLCDPRLSGGKLLYVESVLDGIESGRFSLPNISGLGRLPQGMSEFYRETFRRAYPHPKTTDHYKLMHTILGLLCEQREPLSLSELSAILKLPKKQIRHELETLGALISKARKVPHRSSDLLTEVYYSFDHSSLRLWLISDIVANPYDVDCGQAQDLIRSWAVDEIKLQRTHLWPYLVRHLRSYITPREWDRFRPQLLGNIHWLQARLDHTGINALMQDTDEESVDPLGSPIRALKHVLGQAEQTLTVYPQQLASQILTRLDRTNMTTEIATLCEAAESVCEETQQAIPIHASLQKTQLLQQISCGRGILCLYYYEEQKVVLFGCSDGRVGVWSLQSGGVRYCRPDNGHTDVVAAIAPVSNGRFASASWDGKVILWSLEGLREECTLQAHDEAVNALVCYRFDRKDWLVTASDDQSIKIWQVAGPAQQGLSLTSRPYHEIQSAHAGWVTHLVHLGSNEIASGGKDGSIRIWNIRDGSCRLSFQLEGEVISLSAQKSSQSLYAITDPGDGLANQGYRIDLQSGTCERITSLPQDVQLLLCLENSDIFFFITESLDNTIFRKTRNENGIGQPWLCGHDGLLACFCFSDKQRFIVSATNDRDHKNQNISTISIWHSSEQASVNGAAPLQAHHGRILQIQTNSAGQIYSLAADGSGSLWGHDGLPQAKWHFHDEMGNELIASPQAFSLNDQQLAIRLGNQLLFYTTPVAGSVDAKLKAEFSPLSDTAKTLELSPSSAAWSDVHGLIFGCEDGSILYSAFHSTESRVIQAAIGRIEHMKMLDQFRLFCWSRSSAEDGSFWICELDKKKSKRYPIKNQESSAFVSRTYRVNDDDTHADAQPMMLSGKMELLHACNQYLTLSHADASISIWEWIDENQNPILKHRLHGHSSPAIAFLVLDDGSYITASTDRTIRRWKEGHGKMIDNIIFVNDYRPTFLHLVEQDLEQRDPSTLVIVGDEVGLLHWLKLN